MDSAWLLIALQLIAGFALLAKSADWLVDGGVVVARHVGVGMIVIGLTVIAWGTSAPELYVSGSAAWKGSPQMSLGNVLGSNVANIGLVLGACAAVLPAVMERAMRPREMFWLFVSFGSLWFVCLDSAITQVEGGALLGVFAAHNVHLWFTAREASALDDPGEDAPPAKTLWGSVVLVLMALVGIGFGGHFVLAGAQSGAALLGMPDHVVSIVVLGVGTSLPELAAGLGGAVKGESDISLGNVVGSNVFNVLAVMGTVSVLSPLVPETPDDPLASAFADALAVDFWVVLAFSVAAAVLPWLPKGGRVKGVLLLAGFVAYVAVRLAAASEA